MTKTNKGRVFVRLWALEGPEEGLVNFTASPYTVTGLLCQMHYKEFLWIYGIPLSPDVVYEIRVKATARPHQRAKALTQDRSKA